MSQTKNWPKQVKMMSFSGKRPDLVLLYLNSPCLNPLNTTQYVKSDSFQVLLDRHVMYAIGTASDFELMK